jgi:PQQ-dependent catabolism-associated CXXCW motif protein
MLARIAIALLIAAPTGPAFAFADEDRDWGVAATRDIRQAPYSAPTPLEVPGASRVSTQELKALLESGAAPLLIDVAGGEEHESLKGAVWLPGAGRGVHYFDLLQADLAERLAALTARNKAAPMVFFCVNAQCWLSYNASLRAAALGYTRVLWFRGGIEAWREAGLPTVPVGQPGVK